jgi:hypothetical protein
MKKYQSDISYITFVQPFLQYPKFTDIPEASRTSIGALRWLKAMHTTDEDDMSEHFVQIPKDLIDEEILKFAVEYDPLIIDLIKPEDTPNYQDHCVSAFVGHYMAPMIFHESVRTAETVELMINQPDYGLKPAMFSKSFEAIPWIQSVMTPELHERASRASVHFLMLHPASSASDLALKHHFSSGFGKLIRARSAGRLDLPAKFIASGSWPYVTRNFDQVIGRPKTLEIGLKRALDHTEDGPRALYMSFVKAHPIEDVLVLATTRDHAKLMTELYTEEELRPLMRNNRHLKAGVLESSMGL